MAWHPFKNLGLKFLALGLGSLLWFIVSGERIVERSVSVPLAFRNRSASIEMTNTPPSTVDVRLRGSSGQLARLGPGDVAAYIDLAGTPAGSRVFQVQPDQVTAPFGVEVVQVLSPAVSLDLDRSGAREVPVRPFIDGEPAPGFTRGDVTVDPARIEVIGPESHLKDLQFAITEPVSIAGATATVKRVVRVAISDAALRLKQPRGATVTVAIKR